LEGTDGGVDRLDLPVGVGDEGPKGVQHLLLVVEELPLVVLLGLDAEEVIESMRFQR
jgi:hypothetical protein